MQPPGKDEAEASWDVERKKDILCKHLTTSHWPLKSKTFGPPRTYGKEPPYFNFSKEVLATMPGRYPIVDQFFGTAPEHVLRLPHLAQGAILDFAQPTPPSRGIKRAAAAADPKESKKKKARKE